MAERGVKMRVDWGTDDQGDCGLPDIVVVPGHVVEADEEEGGAIADWLSDVFGFCVQGLSFIGDDGESVTEPR